MNLQERQRSAENRTLMLEFTGVGVSFPLYSSHGRSLKRSLVHISTGGLIGLGANDRVAIEALSNVSFRLFAGDRLGVIGPNGSGKTTLLRVLAGVYQPTSGQVRVTGRVGGLYDLTLGMDYEATGYENIIIRGMVLGLTRPEIQARSQDIAEFTQLGEYLKLPIRTYSSGMLLRLGFAVATSVDLDILLMDEWVSVGDQDFQATAGQRLNAMMDRSRVMVLATHVIPMIEDLCNQCLWLKHGCVMALGSTDEVLSRYQSHTETQTGN